MLMETMDLLIVMLLCGAVGLGMVAVFSLTQDSHRRAGLLPGPDPRGTTGALLENLFGAVPVRRVRQGSVAFEDGSGLLLEAADGRELAALSRLAAGCEVLLERVYELSTGWRLVFGGNRVHALVDVQGFHVAAPASSAYGRNPADFV
jgi:hypothetical protein